MSNRRRALIATVPLALVLFSPGLANAHLLKVTASVQPQDVRVEASYVVLNDEEPADDAAITVRDAAGAIVASGKTDAKGVWIFPRPRPGTYIVRAESSGHASEARLPIPDDSATGRFASWQPNAAVGTAIGLAILLGISLLFWLRGRRKRAAR